ncbi:hypothetical protein JTB14_022012 [Gonioctena quinquepunctata]|nr:hypothetical protein JTB14_022012 [Gonioctena quinquepunctata]
MGGVNNCNKSAYVILERALIYKQLEKKKCPLQKNYGDNKDSNPGSSTNSTGISQNPGNSESTQDLNLAAVVVQAPQPEKHYEQVSRLSFDNLKDERHFGTFE